MNQETKSGQIFDLPTLKRLYTFATPYQQQFYMLIAMILINAVLAPLTPLLIKYTIDHPISEGNYQELTLMLSVMLLVLILQGIFQFWNTYMSGWLGQHIIRDIRVMLYDKIIGLRLKFF